MIAFPLSETVIAHAPCYVTYNRGAKYSPHYWNPWPPFTYSLCHFQGAMTKIKPCYCRKLRLAHCEGYKVHCACAVSRDPCINTCNIFWPRIVCSLYNFHGATITIKGSLYRSIPSIKRFLGNKNCPVKIGSQNGGFYITVLILNIVILTPKRHSLAQNDVLWWRIFS